MIFSSKCTKKRLAAGLRPDRWGSLSAPPDPLAAMGVLLLRGGEGREKWEGGEREGPQVTVEPGPLGNLLRH